MSRLPHLVGMVHLKPLPGSPGYAGSMDEVLKSAVLDATTLVDAGFPALMVENFGDAPFFADRVPPETIASLTRAVDAIIGESGVPVGVNALRNDALAALGVAAATGAAMIRVNVLTGVMYADQGPIVGRAAEVMRKRAELGCEVEVWADVLVKHATPPPGLDVAQATEDIVKRGGADAVIVSGSGTGSSPDLERVRIVREAVGPGVRLVIGSGTQTSNLADLATNADTFIVGSSVKHGGLATNEVDPERARAIVAAASGLGIV